MHYAPQYANFANYGKVLGAYGPRITKSVKHVIGLLKDAPNTRRAVLPLYESSDIANASWAKDCPCTLAYDFMIINDELCMIATMRSNDAWLGMPYDVFVNTSIQRCVASGVGIKPGWYQHQVADLHLYEKNLKAAIEAVQFNPLGTMVGVWDHRSFLSSHYSEIEFARACEVQYRKLKIREDLSVVTNSTLRTLLQCVLDVPIESEVLEHAYLRRHRSRRENNAGPQVSQEA
jgi:hypothetical protein